MQLGQYINNASPVPPINCECERLVHDEKHANGMYISMAGFQSSRGTTRKTPIGVLNFDLITI